MTTRTITECGLPVRRRSGTTPCILEAGHKAWWCQDARALAAADTLRRVDELTQEARAVLGLFGVAMGRTDTERWIFGALWRGEVTLGDRVG